ncbi:MAG: DUF2993 domain-containing protein [Candidatus Nanopelagicales bacterium]
MVWGSAALGLVVLLAIVDRGVATAAARAISDGVAEAGCASASISTELHDFPLLTQLARGRLNRVTVTLDDVRDRGAPLDSVVLDLYDVSTSQPRTAGRVELVATVSPADLRAVAGRGWDVAVGDGALVVTGMDDSTPVQFRLAPRFAEGRLRFDLRDVLLFGSPVAGDRIPTEIVDAVSRLDSDLQDLPFDLDPTDVRVEQAGLVVRAAGTDVDVNGAC